MIFNAVEYSPTWQHTMSCSFSNLLREAAKVSAVLNSFSNTSAENELAVQRLKTVVSSFLGGAEEVWRCGIEGHD